MNERPPALNSMMKKLAHRINVTLKLKSFNDEKLAQGVEVSGWI